jgi:nickel-dependent lactate racemase
MVMPGIAALDTVQAWHSPRFLEHPNATMGVTHGNPVHEESLGIALRAKPDFIVDVALDVQKRLCSVFAGDMEKAWEAGVRYVAQNVYDYIEEEVDIVVTTCGGYPLDLTFYQSVKGMVGALPILKERGTVILATQMAEGVGLPHFREALLETEDILAFPETIQKPGWKFVGDQWQVEELSKAVRHANVMVVSEGIEPSLLSRLFVTPMPSVEDAVAAALEEHGPDATIAVIPKGPYVIPAVRPRQVA